MKCAKACRKGALWAADKETAAACGVQFVEVEHADGVWSVAKKSAAKKTESKFAAGAVS
jgi:hypothetical protein